MMYEKNSMHLLLVEVIKSLEWYMLYHGLRLVASLYLIYPVWPPCGDHWGMYLSDSAQADLMWLLPPKFNSQGLLPRVWEWDFSQPISQVSMLLLQLLYVISWKPCETNRSYGWSPAQKKEIKVQWSNLIQSPTMSDVQSELAYQGNICDPFVMRMCVV